MPLAVVVCDRVDAQVKDSLTMEVDTINFTEAEIAVDSLMVDHVDAAVDTIIDEENLNLLETVLAGHDISPDYWQSDKINPYKNVDLETPFKIKFKQTHFTHPVDDTIRDHFKVW